MGIRESIQELAKMENSQMYSLIAEVKQVDKDQNTIDVQPINGDAEIFDVRLQAGLNASEGKVFYPSIGSQVIVSFLAENLAFVTSYGQLSEAAMRIEDVQFRLDNSGLAIRNQIADLSSEMSKLFSIVEQVISTVSSMQVVSASPGSPSGLPLPFIVSKMNVEKGKLKQVKSSIESLIKQY